MQHRRTKWVWTDGFSSGVWKWECFRTVEYQQVESYSWMEQQQKSATGQFVVYARNVQRSRNVRMPWSTETFRPKPRCWYHSSTVSRAGLVGVVPLSQIPDDRPMPYAALLEPRAAPRSSAVASRRSRDVLAFCARRVVVFNQIASCCHSWNIHVSASTYIPLIAQCTCRINWQRLGDATR